MLSGREKWYEVVQSIVQLAEVRPIHWLVYVYSNLQ